VTPSAAVGVSEVTWRAAILIDASKNVSLRTATGPTGETRPLADLWDDIDAK